MVHPFHPLHGRQFELLCYKHTWGEHRVFFRDEEGHLRFLPASWTDAGPPDPFVVIATGRAFCRMEDLLALVLLVRHQGTPEGEAVLLLRPDKGVKEITP
ncbi:MAG: hypothetical protein HY684_03810 [Chloroflexi bacterium]|nr:hypothetical protein [Chloroflexota bacterium]